VNQAKPSRNSRPWLLWALLGAALVVGGVAGGLIVGATQSSGSTADSRSSTASATPSACPVTSVADQVVPSVVTIAASGPGGSGTGSGEVIRQGGYILTNNHVISIAASGGSVEVLFADGQTVPATITGRDPQTDLAVLKVQTSRPAQGDLAWVIVIGEGWPAGRGDRRTARAVWHSHVRYRQRPGPDRAGTR